MADFSLKRAATVGGIATVANFVLGIGVAWLLAAFNVFPPTSGIGGLFNFIIVVGIVSLLAPLIGVIAYEIFKGEDIYDNWEVALLSVVIFAANWSFIYFTAGGLFVSGILGLIAAPLASPFFITIIVLYLARKTDIV